MTKARRELSELMPSQDVVLEVLDARLPGASSNPLVTELRGNKPCIKLLTKRDLADDAATRAWTAHLLKDPNVVAVIATSQVRGAEVRRDVARAIASLHLDKRADRPVQVIICGVPNVGKSTLINILMERTVATTGDKPAVTKVQQRVVVKNGMIVTDSPGLMWPKLEDQEGAMRLAFAGSIPPTAVDYQEIAMFGAALLLERYPKLLATRFKLKEPPASPEALLFEVGKRRGGLLPGGIVDMHRASEMLVHEFRNGALGRISLEDPPVPVAPIEASAEPAAPSDE